MIKKLFDLWLIKILKDMDNNICVVNCCNNIIIYKKTAKILGQTIEFSEKGVSTSCLFFDNYRKISNRNLLNKPSKIYKLVKGYFDKSDHQILKMKILLNCFSRKYPDDKRRKHAHELSTLFQSITPYRKN